MGHFLVGLVSNDKELVHDGKQMCGLLVGQRTDRGIVVFLIVVTKGVITQVFEHLRRDEKQSVGEVIRATHGVTAGNTYSGQQVTKVYTVPKTYAQTPDLGWQYDGINSVVTTVVFADAFKNFKPTSCLGWFKKFESLTTITGISNLDTSEVTDMSYMFQACKIVTIDVNTFNVSQVTDASGMFLDCDQLTTIYCNQTWSIANSSSMFENCR